jgi:hypothetical protein
MRPQYSLNSAITWIDAPDDMRLLFKDVHGAAGEQLFAHLQVRANGFFIELIDQETGEVRSAEILLTDLAKMLIP